MHRLQGRHNKFCDDDMTIIVLNRKRLPAGFVNLTNTSVLQVVPIGMLAGFAYLGTICMQYGAYPSSSYPEKEIDSVGRQWSNPKRLIINFNSLYFYVQLQRWQKR